MGLKPILPQLDCWMSEMTDHFGVMVVSQKTHQLLRSFEKKWYHSQTWNEPFWEPLLTIIYGEVGQSSRCNLTQLGLLLLTPETGPLRILWPYGLGPNLEKQQKMPWISQNTRKTAAPCSLSAFHINFPQCRPGDGKNTAGQRSTNLGTAISTAWDLNKKGS